MQNFPPIGHREVFLTLKFICHFHFWKIVPWVNRALVPMNQPVWIIRSCDSVTSDFYESGSILSHACHAPRLPSAWRIARDDVLVGNHVTFHQELMENHSIFCLPKKQ